MGRHGSVYIQSSQNRIKFLHLSLYWDQIASGKNHLCMQNIVFHLHKATFVKLLGEEITNIKTNAFNGWVSCGGDIEAACL